MPDNNMQSPVGQVWRIDAADRRRCSPSSRFLSNDTVQAGGNSVMKDAETHDDTKARYEAKTGRWCVTAVIVPGPWLYLMTDDGFEPSHPILLHRPRTLWSRLERCPSPIVTGLMTFGSCVEHVVEASDESSL